MKDQPSTKEHLAFSLDASEEEHHADGKISEYLREITALSVLLREQEQLCEAAKARTDWSRQVAAALLAQPRWWALMPGELRLKRVLRMLRRRGLFDGEAYLKQFPDVASTGMNPLQHYLLHGMPEGRPQSVPDV